MKKVISIIAALVFLTTSFSAFADVTVNSSNSIAFSDTVEHTNDETPTTPYGQDPNYPPVKKFVDGALVVSRTPAGEGENEKASALIYAFDGKGHAYDAFTFGFDIKISGVAADATETTALTFIPGASQTGYTDAMVESGNLGSKTGWLFHKTGKSAVIKPYYSDDAPVIDESTNKMYLKFGDADVKLKQDVYYPVKYIVDFANRTYQYAVVVDGVSYVGGSGDINRTMVDVDKIKATISTDTSADTTFSFDNFYIRKDSAEILVSDTLEVSADGKVSFGAIIPEDYQSPALYINDKFAENLTLTAGEVGYDITAALPAGTTYGDAKIEIRATKDNAEVKASANTTLVRPEVKSLVQAFGTADEQYALGEGTGYNVSNATDGLFEISQEVVVTDTTSQNYQFGMRILSGNIDSYTRINGYINYLTPNKSIVKTDGTANDVVLRLDYRGNAMESAQPATFTVNGNVVYNGTFTITSNGITINGISQIRTYHLPSATGNYFKNMKLWQIFGEPEVKSAVAVYGDESEVTYTDTAVTAMDLSSIKFTFDQPITAANNEVYFADANGVAVADTAVSINSNVVTVTYSGSDMLPSGSYKLVVGKGATAGGTALGANVEAPIEILTKDEVLSPANGATVDGKKVTLKAYVSDADKVIFCVNDETVHTFETASANGRYEYEATIATDGVKYFDVYAYKNGKVSLTSSTFNLYSGKKDADTMGEYDKAGTMTTTQLDLTYLNSSATVHRFTGRVAFEFDLTIPEAGDKIYFELGGATDANFTYPGSGYQTLTDAIGYTGGLFKADGTIENSGGKTYPVNEEFTLKYVCDTNTDTYEVYIDGDLVATKQSSGSAANILANCDVVGCKVRLVYSDVNANGTGAPIIGSAPVRTYQEFEAPKVMGVTADGTDASTEFGYVISSDTESIAVSFDTPYVELTSDLVTVTVNGEAATPTVSYDATANVLTLTGLTLKAGSVIDIEISKDAQINLLYMPLNSNIGSGLGTATKATKIGEKSSLTVFVGDSSKVCVLPLKLETDTLGTELIAFSKFINGGDAGANTYLIIAEYEDSSTLERVKQTKFEPVTMPANSSGAVSGALNVTSAQGCRVMLWNTDFAPLVSVGVVSE